MKINAEKFYNTREGEVVGPMRRMPGRKYWVWTDVPEGALVPASRMWRDDGRFHVDGFPHPRDLVCQHLPPAERQSRKKEPAE